MSATVEGLAKLHDMLNDAKTQANALGIPTVGEQLFKLQQEVGNTLGHKLRDKYLRERAK